MQICGLFQSSSTKRLQKAVTLVLGLLSASFQLVYSQSTTSVYDTAGTYTWTAPTGVTSIMIQVWGAGGAGGGNIAVNNGGGGGGGGAYTTKIMSVTPGTTYTLHVGAGGVGTGGDGQNGETSWFIDSTTVYANGGEGGKSPLLPIGNGGVGGAGAAAAPGAGNYAGGNGAEGGASIAPFSPAGGGGGGSSGGSSANGNDGGSPSIPIVDALGGIGGTSPVDGGYGGHGGGYDNLDGLLSGTDGQGPGGGGGGGGNAPPAQPVLVANGGNGADGRVVIVSGDAIFNQSSSWTAPSCVTSVIAEVWGAGGAGGGNDSINDGAGGGGGGAYSRSVISVTPGRTYAVTVGMGGVGLMGGKGNDGGDSWFIDATTILAKGGQGGYTPVLGLGGQIGLGGQDTLGVGDVRYSGGDGGRGNDSPIGFGGGGGSSAGYDTAGSPGGNAGIVATAFFAAPGGVAPNGGGDGGDGQNDLFSGDGQSGFSPGGGGGGSSDIDLGNPSASGGYGANGRVILTYPSASLVLGDNPIPADSVCPGAEDVPVHSFTMQGSNGCNRETNVSFTTTGTYDGSEVITFKLYRTPTNTFATTTLISSITTSTGPGNHTFPSIVRPASSETFYYWITIDISTSAVEGNTIAVDSTLPGDILATPTPTGSGAASGTQTFRGAPRLSSSLTPAATCSGNVFTYIPTSTDLDSSFTWNRLAASGIAEPAISGVGDINEVLTNTTNNPVNVYYVYETSSTQNVCSGLGVTDTVVVTVNPSPQGTIAGNSICSSDPADLGQLTWTATAGTGPYTLIYEPGTVTENGVVSGTAFTVTPNPAVSTTYTVTSVTDANGCIRTSGITKASDSISVTNANIAITSQPVDTSVCDGAAGSFSITATSVYDYDWEVSTDGGATWASVSVAAGLQPTYSNENTPTLDFTNTSTAHDGYLYRAALSPACGAIITYSDTVELIMNPIPSLSSSTAADTICSGVTYMYVPESATPGATFNWTRAAVTNIAEPAGSGNDTIIEALTNTSGTSVNVTYAIVTTANNCSNGSGENITVTVNPSPVLNSTLTPDAICSGDTFSYAPSSASLDSSFTWSRAAIVGIAEAPSSGLDKINEALTNTTQNPIDVVYEYNTTSAECTVSGPADSVVVTVNPDGFITLTSVAGTDSQSVCINTVIANIEYAVSGSGINANALGLPPGVTGTFAAGMFTISGTPNLDGVYNYTVNTLGSCNQASITGTIVVGLSITSSTGTDKQEICLGDTLVPITYAVGGPAEVATASGLPAGVNQNFTNGVLTLSGTPTEAGGFEYTIQTTGPCSINYKTGKMAIGLSLISVVDSDSQGVCLNEPISDITYKIVGADTANPPTVYGLPAGVTGSLTSPGVFTILGTPTVAGLHTYTINSNGICDTSASLTGEITVGLGLVSINGVDLDSQIVCVGTPLTDIEYNIIGADAGSPPTVVGLPAGVTSSFSGSVLTISGSPAVSGRHTYTITANGTCGNGSNSSVTGDIYSGIGLTSPVGTDSQSVCSNTPIEPIVYVVAGGNAIPTVVGLPTELSIAQTGSGEYTITGTPTTTGVYNFTVTTTGGCSPQGAVYGQLVVNIGLVSATGTDKNQVICKEQSPIVNIEYKIAGGGVNTVTGLPAGLAGATTKTGDPAIFTISGTPTEAGTFTYVLNSEGGSCVASSVFGIIEVLETRIDIATNSGDASQTICFNTAIDDVILNIGGEATGATVSTLPAGLGYDISGNVLTIGGIPDETLDDGTYTYTVTTTGGTCNQSTFIFTLTILNPIAAFDADTLQGKTPGILVNFYNESQNSNTYKWDFATGAQSNVENPSNGFDEAGTYNVVLVASNDDRCPDTTSRIVLIEEGFLVSGPGVFTPNGDGVNDKFKIIVNDVQKVEVQVLNRWGVVVAEWFSIHDGWDGKFMQNNKDCPDGTYFYIVNATGNNGKQITKNGYVTLIR